MLGLLVQAPSERLLPPAATEFPDPFTTITSVRELPDGRVIVLDGRDAVVKLVDFSRKTATQVGRQGGGPGEYQRPSLLLAFPGDSTGVNDNAQQRTLLIDPKGGVAGFLFDGAARLAAPPGALRPSAVDELGRLYFPGGDLERRGEEMVFLDSVPLLRYDRRSGRTDTLTHLRVARRELRIQRTGGKISSVSILLVPFRPHDDWELLPGNRVAVIRTGDYHAEFISPDGRVIRGPHIAYTPVALSDSERIRVSRFGEAPKVKPPFDGPSTTASPDGRIWIQRTTAEADSTARYDVLDTSGRLIARVALPPRTTIAGFGRNSIYLVRRDQDDLEYLGRGPMPRF